MYRDQQKKNNILLQSQMRSPPLRAAIEVLVMATLPASIGEQLLHAPAVLLEIPSVIRHRGKRSQLHNLKGSYIKSPIQSAEPNTVQIFKPSLAITHLTRQMNIEPVPLSHQSKEFLDSSVEDTTRQPTTP